MAHAEIKEALGRIEGRLEALQAAVDGVAAALGTLIDPDAVNR